MLLSYRKARRKRRKKLLEEGEGEGIETRNEAVPNEYTNAKSLTLFERIEKTVADKVSPVLLQNPEHLTLDQRLGYGMYDYVYRFGKRYLT